MARAGATGDGEATGRASRWLCRQLACAARARGLALEQRGWQEVTEGDDLDLKREKGQARERKSGLSPREELG